MYRERVLVVDDEADVLELCRRLLEREGYWVITAKDGQEAINKAREYPIDLLLTDIKMPGMSGLEIAQAMKAMDPNMVCITMTGYSTMSTAIEALRLGVDEFVVKPFTPEELLSSINKALEKVRLRQENIRLRALIPLFELNKTLLSLVRETEILEHVVSVAQRETQAAGALATLVDVKSGQVVCRCSKGMLERANVGQRNSDWPIPWMIIDQAQELVISHLDSSKNLYQEQLEPLGIGSLIGHPLIVQEQPMGVLIVAKGIEDAPFRASDAELLGILSGQAGIAIANARLFAEIQRAYEELQKLDRMKSEFINIAAHELRTPLAILMGYASILEEESTGETRERLEIVVRNATRLRALIDDMLNLRHLERGEDMFHPEPFQLPEVVQSVVADLMPLARDKSLCIQLALDPDLPALFTDRQKVEIILANLLSNAVKFTPPHGEITIRAGVQGQEVLVSVQDTGIGIPAEALDRVFEPFFQVADSLTREHGGIGLGLAIAKGMVERCGGRIWAESIVGKGSRFSFTLPLHALSVEPA